MARSYDKGNNGNGEGMPIQGDPIVRPGGLHVSRALRDKFSPDPALAVPGMPPNWGNWAVPHILTLQGLVSNISKVYRISDDALNDSFDHARFMEYDLGIWECIEARNRSVVLLDWHLEAEDSKDPEQVACCDQLTKILKYTPRFMQLREQLMLADWYGRSAVQIRPGWDWIGRRPYIKPVQWLPIHGDKLVFRLMDEDPTHRQDQVGIRVGLTYGQNAMINKGIRDDYGNLLPTSWQVEATDRGLAYFLTEAEQKMVWIHKHQIQDGAFERPQDAGRIHGVGIRNRIYWEWFMKQNTLQWLMEYIERSAFGLELWFYPMHNDQAKRDAEAAIKARTGPFRNVLMVPIPPDDGGAQQYGVQHVETGLAGADLLLNVVDKYFGHRIKRLILGQTLTTEADATGLGSGVASIHLLSFRDIVKYDAVNLQETMTDCLNSSLKPWNFPNSSHFRINFVIETEPVDADEKLSAMEKAWQMGARIKEKDVLDAIGAAAPTAADLILPGPAQPADPTGEGGGAAPGEAAGQDDEEGEQIEEGEGDEQAAAEEEEQAEQEEQTSVGELEEDLPQQYMIDGRWVEQYAFDPAKHPHAPAGAPEGKGGQFVEHPSSTSHIHDSKKAQLSSLLEHIFGGEVPGAKKPEKPAKHDPLDPLSWHAEPVPDIEFEKKDKKEAAAGTAQWLKSGQGVVDHILKYAKQVGKAHLFTPLQLKKFAHLNPNGVVNGVIKYPKAKAWKQGQLDLLTKMFPPGTQFKRISHSGKKLGLVSGKGGGGEYEIYKDVTDKTVYTGKIESGVSLHFKESPMGVSEIQKKKHAKSLTSAESGAISSWKGSAKWCRVSVLGGLEDENADKAKAFLKACEKAPEFKGVLYRGLHDKGKANYASAQIKAFLETGVGGIWLDNAPMGMSRNAGKSSSFASGKLLLRLHTKTAKVIEHLHNYSGESEHISMPGTKWKIKRIVKNADVNGHKLEMFVELEEI